VVEYLPSKCDALSLNHQKREIYVMISKRYLDRSLIFQKKKKAFTRNKYLETMSILTVFRTMRLDEITKRMSIDREVYIMDYYSAIKSENMSFAGKWNWRSSY
jgi:hypothetical protein